MKKLNYLISLLIAFLPCTHLLTNNVYVTNNNTISYFKSTSNTVIGTVSDPGHTFNDIFYIIITPDGTTAYVANTNNTISIVNLSTNTVTGIVSDPGHTIDTPFSLTITPDGSKVYALNTGNNTISIINTATNTVTGIVNDPGHTFNGNAFAMTINNIMYVLNFNNNTISIVNTITDTVIGLVNDPDHTLDAPFPIAIAPDGKTAYIGNFNSSTVSILDIASNTITGIVNDPSHFINQPNSSIVITPNGKTAYVADNNDTVSIIDLASNTVIGTVSHPNFSDTFFLAITPDGQTMYSTNALPSTVSIISTLSNSVTGIVSDPSHTFDGPYSLAIVPSPNQPCCVNGLTTCNIFLTQADIINTITWGAPVGGPAPVSYNIYRDPGLTQLAGTVQATQPLIFVEHNRTPKVTYSYFIVAVDQMGNVSVPAVVTLTTKLCCDDDDK